MVYFQEGPISTSAWKRLWDPGLEEIPMVLAALLSRHIPTPYPCHTHTHTHTQHMHTHQYGKSCSQRRGKPGVGGRCAGRLAETMNVDMEPEPRKLQNRRRAEIKAGH